MKTCIYSFLIQSFLEMWNTTEICFEVPNFNSFVEIFLFKFEAIIVLTKRFYYISEINIFYFVSTILNLKKNCLLYTEHQAYRRYKRSVVPSDWTEKSFTLSLVFFSIELFVERSRSMFTEDLHGWWSSRMNHSKQQRRTNDFSFRSNAKREPKAKTVVQFL